MKTASGERERERGERERGGGGERIITEIIYHEFLSPKIFKLFCDY